MGSLIRAAFRVSVAFFAVLLMFPLPVRASEAHSAPAGQDKSSPWSFRIVPDGAEGHLSSAAEKALVGRAIEDTYPFLKEDLKEIARQVTFVIVHRPKELTDLVMGWSAEDDPEYQYPNKDFYDSRKENKGAIRVCLSERFVTTLELGAELVRLAGKDSKSSKKLEEGLQSHYRGIISHELKHALQYHKEPVMDFSSRFPKAIQKGLPDSTIMKHALKKLAYEREAFKLGRDYEDKDALLEFSRAAKAHLRDHKDLYEAGGRYHILGPDSGLGFSFAERVRSEAESLDEGSDDFPKSVRLLYLAEVLPPKYVLDLHVLNEELAAGKKSIAEAGKEVARIKKDWAEFMEGPQRARTLRIAPYLQKVAERYAKEMAEFDARSAGK